MVSSLQANERVADFFLVGGCQLRPRRNGEGCYLALRLCDRSGTIEARVWEKAEETHRLVHVDDVVHIVATVKLYNEELQLNVTELRLAQEHEYAIEDFVPVSQRDPSLMLAELEDTIQSISNPHLVRLLRAILDQETLAQLARSPGAQRIHHAYLGGLLEHVLEVVGYCREAMRQQPQLDGDLLLTGAILHDLGKLREYTYARSFGFTDEGRLIGHVTFGHDLVARATEALEGFPPDLALRLRHLILSHHGHYEWQSPKRPKTLEAMVLHLADYFSSQVSIFISAIQESPASQGTWSAYNKYLDRPVFLGGTIPGSSYDEEPTQTQARTMGAKHQGY